MVLQCWRRTTRQSESKQVLRSRGFQFDPFRTTSYTKFIVPNHTEATPLPTLEEADAIYPSDQQFEAQRSPIDPVDPDRPSWGVGSALLLWIASLLLVVFVPLIILIPYASYRGIEFNPGSPEYWPAVVQFAISDKGAVLLQVAALLPIHILTFLLVWALVTRFGKQSFKAAIGWGWPRGVPSWVGMAVCVVLGVVLFVVGSVIAKLLGADTPTQLEQIVKSSYAARFALAFLAVCTAPFVEEFVYRGVLYAALRRGAGTLGASILMLFSVRLKPASEERVGVIAP